MADHDDRAVLDEDSPATEGSGHHVRLEHHVRARSGDQSRGVVALLHHQHVGEVCPACRGAIDLLGREEKERLRDALATLPTEAPSPPPLRPPVDAHLSTEDDGLRRLEARYRRLNRVRKRVMLDLWEIRRLPPERRKERVVHARTRFRTLAFAEVLLETSRELVRTDPREAENLASLVEVVVREVPGGPDQPLGRRLVLRGNAHRANALRVAGELPDAEQAFLVLRRRIALEPSDDLAVVAELASLEASLRLDQRRHAEAEERLDLAIAMYRHLGETEGWGKTLVKRGMLLRAQFRSSEAAHALRDSLRLLEGTNNSRLRLSAVNCAVLSLCDLGRFSEAEEELDAHLDLYEEVDIPYLGSTVRFLQGRIALGLGRPVEAIEQLTASRDGFLELDRVYDAALTTLELAGAHHAAGNRRELERLAHELIPAFRSRGVSREILATLTLLARAAVEERLTGAALEELRRRLEALGPT